MIGLDEDFLTDFKMYFLSEIQIKTVSGVILVFIIIYHVKTQSHKQQHAILRYCRDCAMQCSVGVE